MHMCTCSVYIYLMKKSCECEYMHLFNIHCGQCRRYEIEIE